VQFAKYSSKGNPLGTKIDSNERHSLCRVRSSVSVAVYKVILGRKQKGAKDLCTFPNLLIFVNTEKLCSLRSKRATFVMVI
jgi:hypothetical protein